MTQNTEQKVRTRELQITLLLQEFGGAFYEKGLRYVDSMKSPDLIEAIIEAEARGAAEQRQKDREGEGQEPVAYTSQIDLDRVRKGKSGDIYGSQKWEGSDDSVFTVPLYTHPANVAALEARVKELEAAIQFHDRVKAASVSEKIAVGQDAYNRLDAAMRAVVAALKREGGE